MRKNKAVFGRVRTIKFDDPVTGKTLYALMDDDTGEEIPYVRDYLRKRARNSAKSAQNSINAIAQDLRIFFEYFYAAIDLYKPADESLHTPLADVLHAFPSYLGLGHLTSEFALSVARRTGCKGYAKSSIARILSSVNGFLIDSSSHHASMVSLEESGLLTEEIAKDNLHKFLGSKRSLENRQRKALYEKSWLSGCLSGGARFTNNTFFGLPIDIGSDKSNVEKAFPVTLVVDLLNSTTNARDRCLFSLLLGTGIRTHEAMQLLLDDIRPLEQTVLVIDPKERSKRYKPLPLEWRKKLTWKQRTSGPVYFIEPFRSYFFTALEEYLKKERPIAANSHDFLFVSLSNNSKGRPWYLGDASSHNIPMKNAQKVMTEKGNVLQHSFSLHSLRHWFAVFLLNYIKNGSRYGYDENTVQSIMSHASVETTRKYAIRDRMIVKALIEAFNNEVNSHGLSLESFVQGARSLEALNHE